MTYEEEAALLAQFINEADGGHITDVSAIKTAYDEKIGHTSLPSGLHSLPALETGYRISDTRLRQAL